MTILSDAVVLKRPKHTAPGQYLGFAIQPVRLCYHLLTCPAKAKVSLEYLDDVAIHYVDGSALLEQAKSALSQNPLSDWAVDFWKCLDNWLSSVSSSSAFSVSTQYRLYVTPVKTGARAAALSDAMTGIQIESITSEIKSTLKKLRKLPTCASHLQTFLGATPEARFAVISRFKVVSCDNDPVDPIRALLTPTVATNLVDPLCQFAIGRAKEIADRLIRSGKPALLDGDEFKMEFRNFVQRNNLPGFLAPLTSAPSDGAVSTLLATHPTFVRQLDIIQVNSDERVRAVSDFLRAAADKSSWAEAGVLFQRSLEEWDAELVRRHGLVKGEVSDVHSDKDALVRGRIVYRQSAQMQPPLDGQAVPGHFVHGCLNALADVKTIGWHPDYVELLKDGGQ
ncbi:ABC-three component system protein [Silvibacterium dinghuense]|uniref:ABC-three component systems C-terminal domain-containing protein n=1 Tax=Silvibacterium dinghuense TaxID=1560006 RepID=A0A4Q1SJH1_9BACT|nr:ABC-three component system protein [Silvibacterium dinghuense]RXS97583.1 hypothetical protein ESZ00_06770 [Silvibacterium dinghuense]